MSAVHKLITDHLDIWTAADTEKKSGRGRASGNANGVYGIKKLRELILELAVRGKLVPQDPIDEPASELLKRIQAEKTKLVAEGKIKKDKPQAAISENEYPFELPHDWKWARLSEITSGMDSGWSPACLENNSPSNNVWGVLKTTSVQVMQYLEDENKELPERLIPRPEAEVKVGDILITRAGPTNRVAISCLVQSTRPRLMISDKIIRFHPIEVGIDGRFLALCLNAGATAAFLERAKSGMAASQVNISQEKLRQAPIPIAPLRIQHRIVAKVDELMALCDQLETQHNNAADAHEQLVSHLLSTLTQSKDAADFNANWQRIATHFDTLFTTESSIDALKQTLLQLAVMGKLVPQDPNDEPASELLKRIQVEKARLSADGRPKKEKPPSHFEDNIPYSIPKHWEWVSIENISEVGTGATPLRTKNEYFTPPSIPWVTSGETSSPFIFKTEQFVSPLALNETNLTVYPKGTLIVAMYGQGKTRGQITELMIDACTNQACAAIKLVCDDECHRKYVKLFFEKIYDEIRELAAGGAQPNLNLSKVKETLLPLPPLIEQLRIVTRLDELMNICDQIKTRITRTNLIQQRLANILVEESSAI